MMNKKPAALLTGLLLASGNAAADQYHYNNILIGERAGGFGGAYTAVSDDPSGLFYNPAGIVYANGANLSASANAYHLTELTYRDALGGGDWSRDSSSLLPNFFGVLQPLGSGVAGFSYAVTDAMQENQDQLLTAIPGTTVDSYVLNVNNEDNTYKVGPSYAVELSPSLSFGATLYFHIRDSESITNQSYTTTDPSYQWQNVYLQSQEYGIEPVLGLMWSPAERLSLGLSVRQTQVTSSDIRQQITCSVSPVPAAPAPGDLCTSQAPLTSITTSTIERQYPLTISAGIAYFPSNRLIISADYTQYGETDGEYAANVDSPLRAKAATWNAALGIEYFMSNIWVTRVGLYTNNANTPQLKPGVLGQPEHVDMTGISLSFTRQSRNTSITLGLGYARGTGEAQVVQNDPTIQTLEALSTTIFLASSYNY